MLLEEWIDRYGEELQLAGTAENMLSLGKKQTEDFQGSCFETGGFAQSREGLSPRSAARGETPKQLSVANPHLNEMQLPGGRNLTTPWVKIAPGLVPTFGNLSCL